MFNLAYWRGKGMRTYIPGHTYPSKLFFPLICFLFSAFMFSVDSQTFCLNSQSMEIFDTNFVYCYTFIVHTYRK